MLTPEQAQQRLQAARIPELDKWRLAAIAKLPGNSLRKVFANLLKADEQTSISLREIAYGLIGYDANGKQINRNYQDYAKAQEVYQTCLTALADLSPEDRLHIFQTFFPKVASQIEQVWQFLPHLPYQRGYARKAFRAPGHEDVYF